MRLSMKSIVLKIFEHSFFFIFYHMVPPDCLFIIYFENIFKKSFSKIKKNDNWYSLKIYVYLEKILINQKS